jgi:Ribbon-helix-helix domain
MCLSAQAEAIMGDESVRWTVVVEKAMDIDLRMRLAERGMKKGDLSKYVGELVKRDLFTEAWQEFSEPFSDMTEEEVEELVDEAVAWARSRKP